MVNYHAGGTNLYILGIVPATTTNIVAGLYIARTPTTSFAGMNLANSSLAHPLGNCRLYLSFAGMNLFFCVLYLANSALAHPLGIVGCIIHKLQ